MRRHEQLLENYEDAYFALLMEKVAEQEGERLEKLNQQLLNDPAFAVPEATDRRCLKTIEKCFAHQQRRTTLRVVARVLHIAAIIVAISVLIFTSAFAVSEDFRVATRNLLITVSERYTDFRMETANQGGNSNQLSQNKKSDSFFDYLEVGWIPEGFQLSKSEYNHWVLYENEDSEWVQILFANDKATVQLDTEGADVSDSNISGFPAVIVEKNGRTTILLTDKENGFFYVVIASHGVGFESAIKIAENLIMQ